MWQTIGNYDFYRFFYLSVALIRSYIKKLTNLCTFSVHNLKLQYHIIIIGLVNICIYQIMIYMMYDRYIWNYCSLAYLHNVIVSNYSLRKLEPPSVSQNIRRTCWNCILIKYTIWVELYIVIVWQHMSNTCSFSLRTL